MKRFLVVLASLAVLPLAASQQSESFKRLDPLALSAGTYTVCDDARDPRDTQSIHLKEGDRITIGKIGAASEVQFDRRLVSMVAGTDARQLSAIVEFSHLQNGTVQAVKHLVRMVRDPGYNGTRCTSNRVLTINFCPLSEDGTWQCRALNCETEGACHGGDVHAQS
jgi:hypothetical protein